LYPVLHPLNALSGLPAKTGRERFSDDASPENVPDHTIR
jgi:hypothetical protein